MKKILTLFLLVVAIIFLLLAGCKIKITVPEGGNVITESGSYGCVSERECTIDIYDIYFDETFVAEPDQGYDFIGWRKKHKGLCGGKDKPCHLMTTGFLAYEALMAILESNEVFYLEPVFVKSDTCSGSVAGDSNQFTLRQGEFAVREIRVPRGPSGIGGPSRFKDCPIERCSVDVLRREDPKFLFYALKFSTASDTPTGKYNIQYYTYTGGKACDFFGCIDRPEKIQKNWRFKLKVVECRPS